MIDFDKELKGFKPILNIDYIEDEIGNDDIKDISDYLREIGRVYDYTSRVGSR